MDVLPLLPLPTSMFPYECISPGVYFPSCPGPLACRYQSIDKAHIECFRESPGELYSFFEDEWHRNKVYTGYALGQAGSAPFARRLSTHPPAVVGHPHELWRPGRCQARPVCREAHIKSQWDQWAPFASGTPQALHCTERALPRCVR